MNKDVKNALTPLPICEQKPNTLPESLRKEESHMSERKYKREDIWGNKYWEDDQGNRTYEREDVWGNKYSEDNEGNRRPKK